MKQFSLIITETDDFYELRATSKEGVINHKFDKKVVAFTDYKILHMVREFFGIYGSMVE